ncbi:Skb1 methyltransferase family protein [Coccidioides posadasii C735 delta SOWgp]|uniref:Protein arginine N-methyltransferase n=1 Tax=Coccidioides posadasii (strain C735) TaxID=222929 RepID=C5PD22_COCP7|nr:Skb1 methyltransferase family protein [Coccidioides posadasii C735 delta SOWgp]EER24983.1 Skb1 methyltransferase family protein [Coccidioides posadasii C735 delta SOWgp]|eukprot:XP_003067128.1 Skb1 methyltransferase family protein [Coccidioides posadasii C735 delta SOWgp]
MEASDSWTPTFVVGQHESDRKLPVSLDTVQRVHDCNYDVVTTPITTSEFHSNVLTLIASHLCSLERPVQDACGTLATSQNTKPLAIPSLSLSDSHLSPNGSLGNVIAITSKWIDLCSPDPLIADVSRQILMHEVAYAAFCGVSYVIIQGPRLHHGSLRGEGLMYYARTIQEVLNVAPYIQVHIWFQMTDNPSAETTDIGNLAPFARAEYLHQQDPTVSIDPDQFGTWDAWDAVRRVCKHHSRLFVALTLPKYLPSAPVQSRWLSEPVHTLTIDGNVFVKNQKGYPVLSRVHQGLISRFMRLKVQPWIILCDVGPIPDPFQQSDESPTPAEAVQRLGPNFSKKNYDPTPHLSYIRNLQTKQPPRTPMERFGVGYQDFLQAPLQPLTVNLESVTYEVFEKDPIKYEWYERAIAKALKDWIAKKKTTSSPDGRVVVAVVGAGRGPLVTRAIRASVEAGVDIEMWAVEKNQNAFVHLQRQNKTIWAGSVNLAQSDMRSWKGPHRVALRGSDGQDASTLHYPVDIFVSELLGSFGDNELSPECLDGVTHLLNPDHGISIPASYSAHLTPISSPRLHADVTAQSASNPAAPETPYVVMLHAFDFLSTVQPASGTAGPKSSNGQNSLPSNKITKTPTPPPTFETPTPIVHTAWSFSHPNSNIPPPSRSSSVLSNAHNVRQTRLTFPCRERGVCHGLGGYFETVLYDDVELSTNPVTMDTKSEGMISWFPIYFPLKTPLHVPENSEVVVTMYRQTDDRKVWYEWIVEVYELREGMGNGVRKLRVAMSEFHSSIKDGCLM